MILTENLKETGSGVHLSRGDFDNGQVEFMGPVLLHSQRKHNTKVTTSTPPNNCLFPCPKLQACPTSSCWGGGWHANFFAYRQYDLILDPKLQPGFNSLPGLRSGRILGTSTGQIHCHSRVVDSTEARDSETTT